MFRWGRLLRCFAGAALLVATPALAADASCLDQPYEPADRKILDQHAADFDLAKWIGSTAAPEVVAAVTKHVAVCADQLNWTLDETALAMQYATVSLVLDRATNASPIPKSQMTRLSASVDRADQDRLFSLFRPELDGVPPEQRPAPRQSEIDYFGKVIGESGVQLTSKNAGVVRIFVKLKVAHYAIRKQLGSM